MKLNGTSSNTLVNDHELADAIGENHSFKSLETPIRKDAFLLSDEKKIDLIASHFHEIMHILGLDLTDESLKGTPYRVAKMYVNEVFSGLKEENKPMPTMFDNHYGYEQMLVERDISFYSTCEHHFVSIFGKAHVAYFATGKVIGLSKLNRIVQYYARRPQVQERLTEQIANELKKILETDDVAVVMDANHLCVASRGVKDISSSTVTASYHGKFKDANTRSELLKHIYSR
jgi:GTP cyclohydrolase I